MDSLLKRVGRNTPTYKIKQTDYTCGSSSRHCF